MSAHHGDVPGEDEVPLPGDVENIDAIAKAEEAAAQDALVRKHDHDEELVEEWEDESFPASDPPSNY
ncbi:hypothetical protein ACQ3I4_05950 [Zafaria sp. Z1313]|uniref:hypothetical protein n=1 Tax=unclassified Zafaria TaxID=2828765 RepID=UPI002E789F13|nr:hypothetical protein [Zafaria sp. J156]MEE1622527.1 hypothetical protein [Zafaria sp. J156]